MHTRHASIIASTFLIGSISVSVHAADPILTGSSLWHRDILYDADSSIPDRTSLDIYVPSEEGEVSGRTVIMFLHGGANRLGDKAYPPTISNKLKWTLSQGHLFVSANHRLGDAGANGVSTQDVANAVAWVHENIAEFGGDPNRIVLSGHSSGAMHIVRVAGDPMWLNNAGTAPGILAAAVSIDMPAPALDPSELSVDTGVPPFLFLHIGNGGRSERVAQAFAEGLTGIGVDVKLAELIGKDHFEANEHLGVPGDPATVALTRFVNGLFQ